MTLTLEQFKNESIGQVSVSKYTTQGNSWKDGGFIGECVSEVNQYCYRSLNVPAGAWGDAYQWWTNPTALKYFDQITDGSRQNGDILVWGDDPGNFTGEAGHIAISYDGRILNQNYNGTRRVSINNFFQPGYLGALRLKGDNMKPLTREEIIVIYQAFTVREPVPQDHIDAWTGKPLDDYLTYMPGDPSIRARQDALLNPSSDEYEVATVYTKKEKK